MPKRYAREFRRDICERLVAGERISRVSSETGVSPAILHRWRDQHCRPSRRRSRARRRVSPPTHNRKSRSHPVSIRAERYVPRRSGLWVAPFAGLAAAMKRG